MTERLRTVRDGMLALYRDVDAATGRFAQATGLTCPPGCGACCQNPRIEATVAEMVPAALVLLDRGEAEQALARARAGLGQTCIFFEHHGGDDGRCAMYAARPGVCRLFGFAGTRTKRGDPELAVCWRLGEHQPDVMDRAQDAVTARQVDMPMFTDWRRRLDHVDPSLAGTPLPINQALLLALERVLAAAAYAAPG